MRKMMLIGMVCALVLVGYTATASAHSKARPFKGSTSGQVSFTPDPASPSLVDLWTDSSSAGTASHMGLTTMTARHPTPTTDAINDGNMTLVAANGDEVWATYAGSAPFPVIGVPSTIVAHTPFTIVGGTGRFAHATGYADMMGYVEFPGELGLGPWPATRSWQGRIRY